MLIDNLQQAAIDLYLYLKNPNNKAVLLNNIIEMETKYSAPIQSWWYGNFYQYFRARLEDIQLLKAQLTTHDIGINCAIIMSEFFQKGAWESTSANTYLMLQCIKKLPSYSPDIDDIFLSKEILIRLNNLLSSYIIKIISLENAWLTTKTEERKGELKNIAFSIFENKGKISTDLSFIHHKTSYLTNIKKLGDNPQYNDILLKLEKLAQKSFTANPNPSIKGHSMCLSRLTLAKIIKYHFQNQQLKEAYQIKVKELLEHGLITRAFDHFDFNLLPQQDIKNLSHHFIELLPKINIDAENVELNEKGKLSVQKWEKKIISLACYHLLDGIHIKKEILDLLGLTALDEKQTFGFICAYVGRINQDCMSFNTEKIMAHQQTYFSICSFVSKNYGNWVMEYLTKERGLEANEELYWSLAGLGIVLSAATVGLMLFGRQTPHENNTPTIRNISYSK